MDRLPISIFSLYVPGFTIIVCPSEAASIALWILEKGLEIDPSFELEPEEISVYQYGPAYTASHVAGKAPIVPPSVLAFRAGEFAASE